MNKAFDLSKSGYPKLPLSILLPFFLPFKSPNPFGNKPSVVLPHIIILINCPNSSFCFHAIPVTNQGDQAITCSGTLFPSMATTCWPLKW